MQDHDMYLVKSFEILPDTILSAVKDAQNPQVSRLMIMFTDNMVTCEEVHNGPINDIYLMNIQGQTYVFTACMDNTIRAFQISPDRTQIQKMAEQKMQFPVTRMLQSGEDLLVGTLMNGKFMGWKILANQVDLIDGHGENKIVQAIMSHEQFVLSADSSGIIQVRDQAFNQSVPPISVAINNQPLTLTSLVVLTFKGVPVIFAGDTAGLISFVNINNPVQHFGAHCDPGHSAQQHPIDILVSSSTE